MGRRDIVTKGNESIETQEYSAIEQKEHFSTEMQEYKDKGYRNKEHTDTGCSGRRL